MRTEGMPGIATWMGLEGCIDLKYSIVKTSTQNSNKKAAVRKIIAQIPEKHPQYFQESQKALLCVDWAK